jgi:hypothetical protein
MPNKDMYEPGLRVLLGSTLIALSTGTLLASQQAANAAIVRLKPAAFPALPVTVRRYLDRRGCEIPQAFSDKTPHNVVRGRFTSANVMDIAVLCSKAQVSKVLVFRGGKISAIAELAELPDEGFLQGVDGDGTVGYSRALRVASPSYIRKRNAAYGGPKPAPMDHDGINDIFVGKASVVWYWYRGRWLQLQGAD